MKILITLTSLLATTSLAAVLDTHEPLDDTLSHVARSEQSFPEPRFHQFSKRRGGGGRGGGGSSGGRIGSGSSGSGGGSSRPPSTLPSSNRGGSSSSGSGVSRSFGGGNYYSGGARVPFAAGTVVAGRAAPRLLAVGALGTVGAIGLFHAPIYLYPYAHPFVYRNQSDNNQNVTASANCACQQYLVCGCDPNNENSTYTKSLIGDGSYATLKSNGVYVTNANGSTQLLINGTLANGTTAASAAGGGHAQMLAGSQYLGAAMVVVLGYMLV